MDRRTFTISFAGYFLGAQVAAWAQQPDQMRRIGVLMNRAADNPEGQARVAAFRQALQQLGWNEGRNMRIDILWGEDDVDRERRYAAELVALAPDIILAAGTLSVAALQGVTRTLPIVFAGVADPVGAGFVDTLARPGGNITGFMLYEYRSPLNRIATSIFPGPSGERSSSQNSERPRFPSVSTRPSSTIFARQLTKRAAGTIKP